MQAQPRLHIALVGHGHLPIPPVGWGAVESVIWEYAQRLPRHGFDVDIVNVPSRLLIRDLWRVHRVKPLDWVWVHRDKYVPIVVALGRALGFKVVATGHAPFNPLGGAEYAVSEHIRRLAKAQYHLALTHTQAFGIQVLRPGASIAVQPNGTDVEAFAFHENGNGRAICLGRLSTRKGQDRLARCVDRQAMSIDFVGPVGDFDGSALSGHRYLGEWTRQEVNERLGEYSALVLVSDAEVQPLVVAEAFAAGLSVVVTPVCAANVSGADGFAYVGETLEEAAAFLPDAVARNQGHRQEARTFALRRFSWDGLAERAAKRIQEWHSIDV